MSFWQFLEQLFPRPKYDTDPATLPMNQEIPAPQPLPAPPPPPTKSQLIYQAAASSLGKQMTLDPKVPFDVGCAEACCAVLAKAGILLPAHGIASTADLYRWLTQNAVKVPNPLPGDVIISPTGSLGALWPHGHCGVVLKHGIASNNSLTGLFQENYTVQSWTLFYQVKGHFTVNFFRFS